MVDIRSATAEIRRGKNRKKKPRDENIMTASTTQGGHNKNRLVQNIRPSAIFHEHRKQIEVDRMQCSLSTLPMFTGRVHGP